MVYPMGNFDNSDHPRDAAGKFSRKATAAEPGRLAGLAGQQPAVPDGHLAAAAVAAADCGHHLTDRYDDQGGCCGWCGEPKDTDLARLVSPEAAAPPATLERIAAAPEAPPEVLDQLAATGRPGVVHAVAANPSAPPATLDRLAGDPDDHWLRQRVAWNPNTGAATLTRLAGDPHHWVRQAVAANSSTDPVVLARLADDDDEAVARQAAVTIEADGT